MANRLSHFSDRIFGSALFDHFIDALDFVFGMCFIVLVVIWFIFILPITTMLSFFMRQFAYVTCSKEQRELLDALRGAVSDLEFHTRMTDIIAESRPPLWTPHGQDFLKMRNREISAKCGVEEVKLLCKEEGISDWKIRAFM